MLNQPTNKKISYIINVTSTKSLISEVNKKKLEGEGEDSRKKLK